MPDRQFIHALEDVREGLQFAQTLGLRIVSDSPQTKNTPTYLTEKEIGLVTDGVFLLFRAEWIADSLQMMRIEAGYSAGKYFIKQNMNFAAITLYFQGEERRDGQRRLGSGQVWHKHEWLHERTMEMRPSPAGVSDCYASLCKHLLSRESVRAGVHRYYLCRHVVQLVHSEATLPPFEFIPWPPAKPKPRRKSRR